MRMDTNFPMDMGDMSWMGATESLPHFETELQQLVTDEKLRSEQHKINYKQLKAEHNKLQDQYLTLQEDLKKTLEESRLVQERYKLIVDEGKRALQEKQAQLDEAHSKILSPERMELLKQQLSDDIQRPFKDRYIKAEREVETMTVNCNKLRYDLTFLTAEYENAKTEHSQIIKEMTSQYEAEITNMRNDRDSSTSRMQAETADDARKLRVLQREKLQLTVQNKGLTDELDDLRATSDKMRLEIENLTHSHNKKSLDQETAVKTLEAEKESLKRQVELVYQEFSTSGTTQQKLTNRVHELERETTLLRNQMEEVKHKHRVELSNVKMEMIKQKGIIERERDSLTNQVADMTSQVTLAEHRATKHDQLLIDKERELVDRVQAVKEEEWAKTVELENQKMNLETRIKEIEKSHLDQLHSKHVVHERLQEKILELTAVKDTANREIVTLKSQISSQENSHRNSEELHSVVSQLKIRNKELETSLVQARQAESEMVEVMTRLKEQNRQTADDARSWKQQLEQLEQNTVDIRAQQKAAWVTEKSRADTEVNEVNGDLKKCQDKLSTIVKLHKRYKVKYNRNEQRLKEKIELQRAKIGELTIAREALQHYVAPESYRKLHRKLRELQKRHSEFRQILYSGGHQAVAIGDLTFSRIVPLDHNISNASAFPHSPQDQHEADICELKRRLETLGDFQQQHLDRLHDLTTPAHDYLYRNATTLTKYRSKSSPNSPRTSSPNREKFFQSL